MPSTRSSLARRAFTALLSLTWALVALAHDMSPAARKEVETLLAHVGSSGCEFYRGGTWYNAVDAKSHLERKFRYMANRQMIATAEEFIAKGASKSSMTGEAYSIRCNKAAVQPSAAWLEAELRKLRMPGAAPSQPAR